VLPGNDIRFVQCDARIDSVRFLPHLLRGAWREATLILQATELSHGHGQLAKYRHLTQYEMALPFAKVGDPNNLNLPQEWALFVLRVVTISLIARVVPRSTVSRNWRNFPIVLLWPCAGHLSEMASSWQLCSRRERNLLDVIGLFSLEALP